jgi:hypothetical protein
VLHVPWANVSSDSTVRAMKRRKLARNLSVAVT